MQHYTGKSTSTSRQCDDLANVLLGSNVPTINMELNLLRTTCLDIIEVQLRPFILTDFYEGSDVSMKQ